MKGWTQADIDNIKTPGVRVDGVVVSQKPIEKPKKKSKYGNKITTLSSGLVFDSEKEANRYTILKLRQNAKEITGLQMQVVFYLTASKYIADFTYFDFKIKKFIVEDAKSVATRKLTPYRMKKREMKILYDIDILET
ncbi:MAG: DUF1064 domain-containing protein [Saprospiraceae bacterium]